MRELAAAILERAGYSVLAAATPTTRSRSARAPAAAIDLLLTDVVMPGCSGPDLAGRLTADGRSIRVLYMSGYTGYATLDHRPLEVVAPFLQKPFDRDALLRAVRQALNA